MVKSEIISPEIKKEAVRKFLTRGSKTVASIAEEFCTKPPNLYRWAKEIDSNFVMKNKSIRPQDRSPVEKLNLIISYEKASPENRGEFLRQNGIKSDHIEEWRKQLEGSFESKNKAKQRSELAAEKRKVKELERELIRKDRALAETTALLVLKKKATLIWGTSEDE